jgi:hypothetical protein
MGIAKKPIGTNADNITPFNELVSKMIPLLKVMAPATKSGTMITKPAKVGPGTWKALFTNGPIAIWLTAEATAIVGITVTSFDESFTDIPASGAVLIEGYFWAIL